MVEVEVFIFIAISSLSCEEVAAEEINLVVIIFFVVVFCLFCFERFYTFYLTLTLASIF